MLAVNVGRPYKCEYSSLAKPKIISGYADASSPIRLEKQSAVCGCALIFVCCVLCDKIIPDAHSLFLTIFSVGGGPSRSP